MNAIQIPLNPGYGSKVRDFVFQLFLTLVTSILILTTAIASNDDCMMSWNMENYVGISTVDPYSCVTTIRPDDILTNPGNCNGPKTVTIFSTDDPTTPIDVDPTKIGAQLDETYIGIRLQVRVQHNETAVVAVAFITLEDYTDPELECPDQMINCFMDPRPISEGGDVPNIKAKDCSEITSQTYHDQYMSFSCVEDPFNVGKIIRTWHVVDKFGNESDCEQTILIQRIGIFSGQIIAPPTANLECSTTNPPSIDPEETGYPEIIMGLLKYQLKPGDVGYCDLDVTLTDNQNAFGYCGAGYEIIRTWTITDYCYPDQPMILVQKILVEDKTGPVISNISDQTVGTSNGACATAINIPPADISDECSNYTVKILTPFGDLDGNGGIFQNIPVGMHTFTYQAKDECGNKTEEDIKVTVIDDDAPNVVCDQFTVVPLGVDGTARVQALSFDDGSTDNCGILNYEVSRMASDCGPETDFGPHVDFSCCDLDAGPVMVALKVTDGAGKFNICMIEVTVQDKAAPVISCPPPADLDCDEDYKNLALTGLATAEDNCVVDSIYFVDDEELNNCGWGTVTRKWIARDKAGNEAECYQTITITNRNPFVSMDITWPENYTATECGASILPENLPIPNARPILDTLPCDNVVTDYHDLAIGDDGGAACYVIHREWTVTDLCVYDPNDEMSGGQWTMVQQIFIVDNTDPIFIKGNEDIDIEIDGNCVDIPYTIMADVEDCSPNLTYSYEVDLFSNGTNDYNGIGQMKELDFTAGYHEVKWTVTDGCSNEATATQTLYFKDIKAPTPVLEALFVGLMPMQDGGEVDVKARGFNSSSTDNCTEATALRFAFSEDITDTVQTFTCEDVVGPFEIDVYVFDDEENWAFATTYVDIQDQNDVCPEVMANVTGMITTPAGEEISDVTVTLEGGATDPFMTDNNGLFSFSVVPGGSYMLKPYKDVDAMNGVSTYDMVLMQRHILGLAEFSDPYTIIAADVNKSGSISTSDMVAMRRLILNINEDFGSNQSWRFVHADYDFSGDDILTQEFPEAYELNSMSGNMEIDFIGIKVGDMNASVDPSGLLGQASNDDQALEFSLENIALKAGNTYEIAFKAKDFNDIIAFQYTLEFDPSIVSVNHIASGALEITEENYNMSSADNGAIATNWYDALPVSLSDEETLFTITLSAHENIHLSDAIGLGSSMTNAESYRQSSFSNPVQTGTTLLDFYSTIKEAAFELGQNMPNPFSDVTTIEVMVPRTSKGSLAVFDLTGKILMQVDQEFSKGMNEIMITSDRLPSNGIYYYKLSVDDFTDTRKMIVIH